MSIFSVEA
uniref:Uncharacterized protein n=1 Tax=Anguilla anguilla TaxID=7936 RepID=A0A0E9V5B0_ANGAN